MQIFSQVLTWLQAKPIVVTLIVWPIVTGIINTVWLDASEYIDTHPKLAILKKIIQKIGLSPRGLIALVAALFSKANLPPPPPGSGDVAALIAGALPAEKTDPAITVPELPKGQSR